MQHANGSTGAHGSPNRRRANLPRVSSIEGIAVRFDLRRFSAPAKPGFKKPGSRNPRKVTR